jgi:hypothetical protein
MHGDYPVLGTKRKQSDEKLLEFREEGSPLGILDMYSKHHRSRREKEKGRKHLCSLVFDHCDKIPEKINVKGGKTHFGSWFQSFHFQVTWPRGLWALW